MWSEWKCIAGSISFLEASSTFKLSGETNHRFGHDLSETKSHLSGHREEESLVAPQFPSLSMCATPKITSFKASNSPFPVFARYSPTICDSSSGSNTWEPPLSYTSVLSASPQLGIRSPSSPYVSE